jgi:DNA-binding MarR family transcriptional regulator
MSSDGVEQRIGFLLNDASRLLRVHIDVRARRLGLTRSQWRVLLHLSNNEGISQSGLAEIIEVERMTLGRLIDRLEAAGWVRRQPDLEDRRVKRLYLAKDVQPTLREMLAITSDTLEQALSGLSAEDRRQLAAHLAHIKENMARAGPSPPGGSRGGK